MTSQFFERRSLRNQLKTYLDAHGWSDLRWAEGFSGFAIDEIVPPFIAVVLVDYGREQLEMGTTPDSGKSYTRRAQINSYMEDESRALALCDDIADFLDLEAIIIKDNTNTILGSMISETSSIITQVSEPAMDGNLTTEWEGIVACQYDVYYSGTSD